MNTITVKLESTGYFRFPCVLCSGWGEKHSSRAIFKDKDGTRHTVCDNCLKAGPGGVKERIEAHIAYLEGQIGFLHFLAKHQWELPTVDRLDELEVDDPAEVPTVDRLDEAVIPF